MSRLTVSPGTDLRRCAADSPAGGVAALAPSTRDWAASLPLEIVMLGMHSSHRRLLTGRPSADDGTTVRAALLVMACKDPEILDDLDDSFDAFLPPRMGAGEAPPATAPPSGGLKQTGGPAQVRLVEDQRRDDARHTDQEDVDRVSRENSLA